MSGEPDPKSEPRVVDAAVVRAARLYGDECVACGRPPGSTHHVIPRGERGDDVAANLVMLCGTGTSGCHGAWHGNPYEVERGRALARIVGEFVGSSAVRSVERRDAVWVAQRIGHHLAAARPDTIAYVLAKLEPGPGRAYLLRRYHLDVEPPAAA